LFAVRVTPRASANGLGGVRDGALLVRVTAAPAEGAANEAVAKLLARALDVPPSEVRLESGHAARTKRVSVPVAAAPALARVVK
jgi:uncharacterized protein YggU (UPF0235/DUF167 family)